MEPHGVNVRRHTLHGLLYGSVQPAGQRQSEDFHAILVSVPVSLFVFGFVPVHTASVLTVQFQYSEHGIKQTASVFRAEVFLLPGQFRRLCDVFDGVQDLLLLLIRELIEPGIEHRVGTWPFVQQNVVGAGIQDFAQVDECCNRSPVTPRSRPETYCLVTSGSSDTCSCVMFRLRRHCLIRRPICTLSGFFFLFSRKGSSMTILKILHEVRNKAVIVKGKCCSFV